MHQLQNVKICDLMFFKVEDVSLDDIFTHTKKNLEFLKEKMKLSPSYVRTYKFYTDSTINLWK